MRIGPKYKIARRLGDAIFPKTQKERFAMVESKKKASLSKKRKHRSSVTEYGQQFLEKQKVRYTYGVTEKQLRNLVKTAKSQTKGNVAGEVFKSLETRLDNVVYKLGFVPTRQFGRQIVGHGHIFVNGKKVSIPSYHVKVSDVIGINPSKRESGIFRNKLEILKEYKSPSWLVLDPEKIEAKVMGWPEMGDYETNLNFPVVVQFYSRV